MENEESRRYIKVTPELYVPKVWRKAPDGSAKQGSSEEPMNPLAHMVVANCYEQSTTHAIKNYEWMVSQGVAPEQARFVLPQGCYTNWIWTGSLLAFSRFYNMRTDPHAQKEIQELAKAVGEIIEPLFPVSWAALTKGA